MTKATEDEMAELHGAVAVTLKDVIQEGVTVVVGRGESQAIEKVTAPAAYLAAAIAFLKNNNITADASSNQELDDLTAALKKRRLEQKDRMSKRTVDDLADQLHKDMGGFTQ